MSASKLKKLLLYFSNSSFSKRFKKTSTNLLKSRLVGRRHNLTTQISKKKRQGHKAVITTI